MSRIQNALGAIEDNRMKADIAVRLEETTMMMRLMSCAAALMLLVVAAPAAAQSSLSDRDLLNLPHSGGLSHQDRNRYDELNAESTKHLRGADQAPGQKLPRLPPLPVERNVLLGSWRVEGGGQGGGVTGLGQGKGTDRNAMTRELLTTLSNPCVLMFGKGITFAPSTYSIQALDGSVFGGSVDYRSPEKQVIVATTGNLKRFSFEIAGPNRIVLAKGCALVRVGAPAANAAANATTAPGNARTGAANSSVPSAAGAAPQVAAVEPAPPPSTLSRPSPEVCRNTLLDQLGSVGVNQVRAMSDVRFKEAAIEGKVPNTNNLRIDLRGSACDDPRIKATLYDFDANGMLQSITYVWDRPAGSAPTPIFNERARLLANWYAPGPAQSPSRWQGTSTAARVTLQDLPERALLLEAYAAPR